MLVAGVGGFVEAGIGPAVAQGAVEAFDLAVGLWPVWAGALVHDSQSCAGAAPGVGSVGRTVARDYLLTVRSVAVGWRCPTNTGAKGPYILCVTASPTNPSYSLRLRQDHLRHSNTPIVALPRG